MNETSRGARRRRAFRSLNNQGGTARGGHAIIISMDRAPDTTGPANPGAGSHAGSDNSVVANAVTNPGAGGHPVTPTTDSARLRPGPGARPLAGAASGRLGRWIGHPLFWIVT